MENLEKNTNNNIEHIKKVFFWRSAFFGLIILFAGIAIGGASMSIVASHRMKQKPSTPEYSSLTPRLVQILGLQQQQISKIRPIIDKHMQHLYEIREDARVDIANTLDQMNKDIYPILGEIQRNVWSNELIRIRRQLNPEPARNPQGGRGARRGAGQSGQGAGRYGRGGQPLNQRSIQGARRGMEIQPSPSAPNSPLNNINEDINKNDINSGNLEQNNLNE